MKKILNKILSCMAVLVMVLGCGFLLTACDGENASKVMNLSINPSIELLLDGNNKVLSVSANNDEGNFIIANASFVGLSAEEAVDLFLEINYENGFIVKGNVTSGENKLEIDISGENAQNLFNKVKASANEYLAEVGATVQIELDEILDKEDLRDLVEECMQELSDAEIKSLSEEELLDLIKKSREETKTFLSEELKELYYEARGEEILKQKFDAIQTEISKLLSIPGLNLSEIKTNFNNALQSLTTQLETFKNEFKSKFLDENSEYQLAKKDFIAKKKALLEARLNEVVDIAEIEQALEASETALENAELKAEEALNLVDDAIESAISTLSTALNQIALFLNENKITSAIEEAQKEFNSNFKAEFASYIDSLNWDTLKPTQNA